MIQRMRHKRTLRRMLQDPRYTRGRTLKALRDGIGSGRVYTRDLLIEIGARGTTLVGPVSGDPVEGWTLRPVPEASTISLGAALEAEGTPREFTLGDEGAVTAAPEADFDGDMEQAEEEGLALTEEQEEGEEAHGEDL